MYNKIFELIMKVDFEAAERIFLPLPDETKCRIIEKIVYSTESMIIYSFVQYLNEKDERILFHEIEFDMLTNALCHIEGAYQMALYHNRRLLQLAPQNIKYLEWILTFYDIKVIDKNEAKNISKKILGMDENNIIARNMLSRLM